MFFIAAKNPDGTYFIDSIENNWHDVVDSFEPIDVLKGEVIIYDDSGRKFMVGPDKKLVKKKLFWKVKTVDVGEWNFKNGEPYLIDMHEKVPKELSILLLDYIERTRLIVQNKQTINLEELVMLVAPDRVKQDMPEDVIAAHSHCSGHREELEASKLCGCFYCLRIFPPNKIVEWIDDPDETAMCPFCGIDSVIGDKSGYPLTEKFLSRMYRYWFDD